MLSFSIVFSPETCVIFRNSQEIPSSDLYSRIYYILHIVYYLYFLNCISPNSLLLGVLNSFLRCVRPFCSVRPFPLAMQHFYSCVSQGCHWWCLPFSAGRVACLFMCLPGLSLLVSALFVTVLFICSPGLSLVVSALFCWPCSISIHLSATSVTAGVRPFPLAM